MNNQQNAETLESHETSSNMVTLSSFLTANLASSLADKGYKECPNQCRNQINSFRSWEDCLFTESEAADFTSAMTIALLSEVIEPQDKGYTILTTLTANLEDIQKELSQVGLKSFAINSEITHISEETTGPLMGTVEAIADFFRSDLGRATSIGRLIVLGADTTDPSATKDLLSEACKRGNRPQIILVGATASESLKDLSRSFLRANAQEETHYFVQVETEGKSRLQTLLDTLETETLYPAIIFCKHSSEVNSVESALRRTGLKIQKLAGRVAQQKVRAVQLSVKDQNTQVVVTTDEPAENLELDKFALIVNFSIPSEPEIYIHRTESPLSTLTERKIVSIITQLDQSNFDYIKKIVSAKFQLSAGPDVEVVLDRQAKKLEATALQEIDKCNARIINIASRIASSSKSKEVIAYLLNEIESKQQSREKPKRKNREETIETEEPHEHKQAREDKRGQRDREQEEHRYEVKKTGRVYIGHGRVHGISSKLLKDIKVPVESGEAQTISSCSVRKHYSFVDVEEALVEQFIKHLQEHPPIKVDKFIVNKAITIATKERIETEGEPTATVAVTETEATNEAVAIAE